MMMTSRSKSRSFDHAEYHADLVADHLHSVLFGDQVLIRPETLVIFVIILILIIE